MNKILRRSGMAFVVTGMVLGNMHAVKAVETEVKPSKVDNVYVYDQSALMNEYTEAVTSKPTYIIYPDQEVDEAGADQLLDELGMKDHLKKYATAAYIVNTGEDGYTKEEEDNFLTTMDSLVFASANTKVIGVGNGADFVNNYVSQKDWMLSGIMTFGGYKGTTPKYSVPAYISNSAVDVKDSYIASNHAEKKETSGNIEVYSNKNNKFENVVYNTSTETLAESFNNAWNYVFSKNGRLGNITGTFYTMPDSKERPYEYTTFFMADKVGLKREVVKQDLDNDGKDSLWYEYNTEATLKAEKGTVPLVLLLHGNGNDPRTQIETSGWAEVAAKNNIMLVEPEWQGKTIGGYSFDPMTEDDSSTDKNDILTMIEVLKKKYPQIDASRIYVEGLSRGSRNSLHIGLVHPEVFAGLGIHSGGINPEFVEGLDSYVTKNQDKYDMPVYMAIGTKDVFNYLPVATNAGGVNIQVAIQYYQRLNNMPVTTQFIDDGYYGVDSNAYTTVENAGSLLIKNRTITNDKGVSISLNAIEDYGHWNYEPTATEMWKFFSQYSRDVNTGEIVLNKKDDNTNKPGNNDSTPTVKPDETTDDKKNETTEDKKNETTDDKKKDDKVVKTGDTTVFGLFAVMSMLSAIAFITIKKYAR